MRLSKTQRNTLLNKNGVTLWFTGLSGSGKSTLSFTLEKLLINAGHSVYSIDGDILRNGLNRDLSFTPENRKENIRRVAEVSKLFVEAGHIVLCSFISPYTEDRENARKLHSDDDMAFCEIHVKASLNVCEGRDVKGLYRKARAGEIKDFTGIHQAYQIPENPELVVDTENNDITSCVNRIIQFIVDEGHVSSSIATFLETTTCEIPLRKVDCEWLQVISEGWCRPLSGFMSEDELLECLHFGTITVNGSVTSQTLPIILPVQGHVADSLKHAGIARLTYNGVVVGTMRGFSLFPNRKEERSCRLFGCRSKLHPYIKMIEEEGDWLVGGSVEAVPKLSWNDGLDCYRLTPSELKNIFKAKAADAVIAFQLRNPIHNGHALLMKQAMADVRARGYKNPVLLVHPLGGWTKTDDIPLNVRMRQHQACLEEGVLDPETTVLAIFPSPMMYAGPKEVQWHCRGRIEAGVTFYIVGRDPAGIGHPERNVDLYDPSHGARVLKMARHLEGVEILPFKVAAFNKISNKMDFYDPERPEDYIFISGTKMRNFAKYDTSPPEGFMSPRAWQVISDYYKH